MVPFTERQKTLIVNNLFEACKDIERLNNTGYKYIHLCSGFIAHYNRHGFIGHYSDNSLALDILENSRFNRWEWWSSFGADEKDYEYYMSKKDIYNRICNRIMTELEF